MNMTAFLRGVCVGMVAGAAVDMAAHPYPKARKTAVGKAMQRWVTLWTRRWSLSRPCCTEVSRTRRRRENGSFRRRSV